QVIGRRRHRGVAAVTAQPAPQLRDLSRQSRDIRPQLRDCLRLLLRYPCLLGDHLIPGCARHAVRGGRWQTGHNQSSSSPADSNQADTLSRLREDHHTPGSSRHVTETAPSPAGDLNVYLVMSPEPSGVLMDFCYWMDRVAVGAPKRACANFYTFVLRLAGIKISRKASARAGVARMRPAKSTLRWLASHPSASEASGLLPAQ